MDKKGKDAPKTNPAVAEPKCLAIAAKGIHTGVQFARFMSAVMVDLIQGQISPAIGNAACNAGGKLLKVVELQHRYGTPGPGRQSKILDLTMDGSENGLLPSAGEDDDDKKK